jgi:predicted DNA-binding transcriptional regulator AlpA
MPDSDKEDQERLIGERERHRITSVSRAQCWRLERDNKFPRRLYLGPRTVRWRLTEVLTWIAELPTASSERLAQKCHKARAVPAETHPASAP